MDDTGSGASTRARCAVHADRDASKTCARCGNFGCEACFSDAAGARFELCASCREREGVGQIPWERPGGVLRRYSATIEAAIREPSLTFGALRGGLVSRSLTFALISCTLGVSPFMIAGALLALAFGSSGMGGSEITSVLIGPVLYPAASLFCFSLTGVIFHAAARLAGGRASFGDSMRAAWYTTAWEPIAALIAPLFCIPALGVLLVGAMSAVSAWWRVVALRAFAVGAHGLSRNRALVVASVAGLVLLMMWVTPVVLVIGFAIWQRTRTH